MVYFLEDLIDSTLYTSTLKVNLFKFEIIDILKF